MLSGLMQESARFQGLIAQYGHGSLTTWIVMAVIAAVFSYALYKIYKSKK